MTSENAPASPIATPSRDTAQHRPRSFCLQWGQDLVIANRIPACEGDVVDAYGHVSARHADSPRHFLIKRSVAEAEDIDQPTP